PPSHHDPQPRSAGDLASRSRLAKCPAAQSAGRTAPRTAGVPPRKCRLWSGREPGDAKRAPADSPLRAGSFAREIPVPRRVLLPGGEIQRRSRAATWISGRHGQGPALEGARDAARTIDETRETGSTRTGPGLAIRSRPFDRVSFGDSKSIHNNIFGFYFFLL